MDIADIHNRFVYHKPADDLVAAKHDGVRNMCADLAHMLNDMLPESREKSLAITHLEEVMMWANAAIARHQ